MPNAAKRTVMVKEAWIGDAVLTLWARLAILRDDGQVDGDKCNRMTSNRSLASLGEPTKVEAEIGRAYADGGLEAAFSWIEARLRPLFERQEDRRAATRVRRPTSD